MTRPKLRSRMPLHTGCVMLKTPNEIGVDHLVPLLRRHPVEHAVAGDAGIVDQHLDRAEVGLDLLDAGGAGIVVGDVPFVDRDAGLGA